MTHSMTAFARVELPTSTGQLTWEVRSVNHRYLDLHLKLPEEFRALETACRNTISAEVNRGRIDAMLKFDTHQASDSTPQINSAQLSTFLDLQQQLEATAPGHIKPTMMDILKWPGMLMTEDIDFDALSEQAIEGLKSTMSSLVEHRQREGDKLKLTISTRIQEATEITRSLKASIPELRSTIKERLLSRIAELTDELDEARINQEIAILLNKSDIDEEIDRLETHFEEVNRVLESQKPGGRRLDFLMQELNREANTIGSKSVDLDVSSASVNLKVLIDQMREQVQNIE